MANNIGTVANLYYGYGVSAATPSATILWTNPSPSTSFSDQNVSLSNSITNYNFIAISYYIIVAFLQKYIL
jgi:hypothetical protein